MKAKLLTVLVAPAFVFTIGALSAVPVLASGETDHDGYHEEYDKDYQHYDDHHYGGGDVTVVDHEQVSYSKKEYVAKQVVSNQEVSYTKVNDHYVSQEAAPVVVHHEGDSYKDDCGCEKQEPDHEHVYDGGSMTVADHEAVTYQKKDNYMKTSVDSSEKAYSKVDDHYYNKDGGYHGDVTVADHEAVNYYKKDYDAKAVVKNSELNYAKVDDHFFSKEGGYHGGDMLVADHEAVAYNVKDYYAKSSVGLSEKAYSKVDDHFYNKDGYHGDVTVADHEAINYYKKDYDAEAFLKTKEIAYARVDDHLFMREGGYHGDMTVADHEAVNYYKKDYLEMSKVSLDEMAYAKVHDQLFMAEGGYYGGGHGCYQHNPCMSPMPSMIVADHEAIAYAAKNYLAYEMVKATEIAFNKVSDHFFNYSPGYHHGGQHHANGCQSYRVMPCYMCGNWMGGMGSQYLAFNMSNSFNLDLNLALSLNLSFDNNLSLVFNRSFA